MYKSHLYAGNILARPSLRLAFAADKSLPGIVTFTRASSGTYFDSSGVMQTASTNVARFTHDPATGKSLGLLIEESRTNLLTYSEEFDNAAWTKSDTSITANSTIAPDGTTTGDTITASATSASHSVNRGAGTTTGSVVSSIFAKQGTHRYLQFSANSAASVYANFDLASGVIGTSAGCTAAVEVLSNGWFRLAVAYNAALTVNSAPVWFMVTGTSSARGESWLPAGTETIYIWGAQLEAGSFPTSYIKTTSSTVTRAADSASMTGDDFSSWYNQAEGTLVVESKNPAAGKLQYLAYISDGTANNSIRIGQTVSGKADFSVVAGGVVQASFQTIDSASMESREATAYANNSFAQSVNGISPVDDTSGSPPAVDRLQIGSRNGSSDIFNGTIASIAYYPKRLSNSYLQYLTS